jgi:AP-2 complex subunit mu-1
MASSILFINEKGDILIFRKFRDDVSRKETQNFCNKIVAAKEVKETPMVEIDGVTFMHTTVNDVTVVATTKSNCNVTMIIEFLYQLIIL